MEPGPEPAPGVTSLTLGQPPWGPRGTPTLPELPRACAGRAGDVCSLEMDRERLCSLEMDRECLCSLEIHGVRGLGRGQWAGSREDRLRWGHEVRPPQGHGLAPLPAPWVPCPSPRLGQQSQADPRTSPAPHPSPGGAQGWILEAEPGPRGWLLLEPVTLSSARAHTASFPSRSAVQAAAVLCVPVGTVTPPLAAAGPFCVPTVSGVSRWAR